MRTTVEIDDRHRAALLEMAARRGEKGFSGVARDALDAYLKDEKARRKRQREGLTLRGSLKAREAAALRKHVSRVRQSWR